MSTGSTLLLGGEKLRLEKLRISTTIAGMSMAVGEIKVATIAKRKELSDYTDLVCPSCGATPSWKGGYDCSCGQHYSHWSKLKRVWKETVEAVVMAKLKTEKGATPAQLYRMDYLPASYIPPKEIRHVRDLLRHRIALVRQRTQVKNRIHHLLEKSGVKTARLGIDVELVRSLGLKIEDVRESLPKDPLKLTHFKNLQKDYPQIADIFVNVIGDGQHPYRIEIDGVFALAGKERFMEAILARADQVVPIKPLKKVLIVRRVPEYVDKLRWAVFGLLDKVFEKVVQEELEPYEEDDRPFSKISLNLIEETIEDSINESAENKQVNKILEVLVVKLDGIVKERMDSDERLD